MPYKDPVKRREYEHSKRQAIRREIDKAKNKPCVDCGNQYHPSAMQFDHITGEKNFDISKAVRGFKAVASVITEIDKCEIVCANCHSVRTWKRKKGTKWERVYTEGLI